VCPYGCSSDGSASVESLPPPIRRRHAPRRTSAGHRGSPPRRSRYPQLSTTGCVEDLKIPLALGPGGVINPSHGQTPGRTKRQPVSPSASSPRSTGRSSCSPSGTTFRSRRSSAARSLGSSFPRRRPTGPWPSPTLKPPEAVHDQGEEEQEGEGGRETAERSSLRQRVFAVADRSAGSSSIWSRPMPAILVPSKRPFSSGTSPAMPAARRMRKPGRGSAREPGPSRAMSGGSAQGTMRCPGGPAVPQRGAREGEWR
jgi:hypothetical protein